MEIVFDIETSAFDFESLSESQQEYILRYASKEIDPEQKIAKSDEAIRYLSLYPFTAEIVCISLLNSATGNTLVLYNAENVIEEKLPNQIILKTAPEKTILELFWKYISQAEKIISFNGKQFDLPFLMIRSSVHKIRPSINFLYKTHSSKHIDLLDKLTYNGSLRKFNLDFYCNAYNIPSPKSDEINGMEIRELHKAGKIKEIATYCAADAKATFQLYTIWNDYLNVK